MLIVYKMVTSKIVLFLHKAMALLMHLVGQTSSL